MEAGSSGVDRRRFTVQDVYAMVAAGILDESEPVELLDGELFVMTPQGPAHASVSDEIRRRLEAAYGTGVFGRTHGPIQLSAVDLPEPDVAMIRGTPSRFLRAHPTAADVILVVEVAITSHDRDRRKALRYAHAGIECYWMVDLEHKVVLVHADPSPAGYGRVTTLTASNHIGVPHAGVELRVAELLP